MGDMGIELLSQSISRTKSLIHLDVSSNEISSKGGRILFNSILYNESITCLYAGNMEGLHRNTFNDTGIQPLEAVLDYNQFLSFLNLGGTLIGNEGLRYVANGLENNKTLYQLNIAQNYLSLPSLEPFISIMQSKRLIDVDASNNPFGDKVIHNTLYVDIYIVSIEINRIPEKGNGGSKEAESRELPFHPQGSTYIFRGI